MGSWKAAPVDAAETWKTGVPFGEPPAAPFSSNVVPAPRLVNVFWVAALLPCTVMPVPAVSALTVRAAPALPTVPVNVLLSCTIAPPERTRRPVPTVLIKDVFTLPALTILPALSMLNTLALFTVMFASKELVAEAVSVTLNDKCVNCCPAAFHVAEVLMVFEALLVNMPRVMVNAPFGPKLPRTVFVLSRASNRFAVWLAAPVTLMPTWLDKLLTANWLLGDVLFTPTLPPLVMDIR